MSKRVANPEKLEELDSKIQGEDYSSSASVYNSRISSLTKKILRKYNNGKCELYIDGITAEITASGAATILQFSTGVPSMGGVAIINGVSYPALIADISGTKYLNLMLNGTIANNSTIKISMFGYE